MIFSVAIHSQFTVEKSQSNEFIMLVNVKSKVKYVTQFII